MNDHNYSDPKQLPSVYYDEFKKFSETPHFEKFIGADSWSWFITITSRHQLTLQSTRRVANKFAKRIESAGGWQREHNAPSYERGLVFWVAEPHKHAGEGFHLHCLVKLPKPRFMNWKKKREFLFLLSAARNAVGGDPWTNAKGQIGLWHRCDIQSYKGKKAAAYCAKYVTKRLSDWDFFPIL